MKSKNPLGGLRGAAQLLERMLPDPALMEYTQIIIEQADRLRGLVDRLLGPQRPGRKMGKPSPDFGEGASVGRARSGREFGL